jgi:thiamine-monophosphate kinase
MPVPNSGDTRSDAAEADGEKPWGEIRAIARIRAQLPEPPPDEVWIGDDAAVLTWPPKGGLAGDQLLLTTDLSVAGVHGDLAVVGLADFGWRAMASAVSDIAAMGGAVGHAVVAVAGPRDTDLDLLYAGIDAASEVHGCPVVGGDLSIAPVLVVSVTVTGTVPSPPGAVRRRGADPGDHIVVTGPVGAAAAGRRLLGSGPADDAQSAALVEAFLHPRARLAAGMAARRARASAMIDVSDGLVADLYRLADASAVGVALEDVPVADGATFEEALGGGEDYELVITTADLDALHRAFMAEELPPPLRIGMCAPHVTDRTLRGEVLKPRGYFHPFV